MSLLFIPPPPSLRLPVSIVFNEARGSSSDNANNSFTSVSFGAEDSSRKVLIFAAKRNTGTLPATGVTVGGTATTLLSPSTGPDAADGITCGWYVADKPTGASGTVQINFPSGSGFSCYMACYSIYNSGASTGYRNSALGAVADGSIATTGVAIPSGAGVLSAYAARATNSVVTWTGVTENDDRQVDDDIRASCGSSVNLGAALTGQSISVAYATSNQRAIQTVVFPPL